MIYTTNNRFEYTHCVLEDNNKVATIFYNNITGEFIGSYLTEKEFIDSIGYKSLVEHVNFVLTRSLDKKETNLAKDFKKRYIEYFI